MGRTAGTESASLGVVLDLERQVIVRVVPDDACGSCSAGVTMRGASED